MNRRCPKPRRPAALALLKRIKVCSNSKFNVFFDQLKGSRNTCLNDYLVISPRVKANRLITGVAVLPVCKGRIGLIRIHRHAVDSLVWEIPRGFVDQGETPLVSARRELLEETGLVCQPRDWISLGYLLPESGLISARIQLFLASRCCQTAAFRPEEEGHLALKFFPLKKIASMITTSRIQDPSTIVAFYRTTQLGNRFMSEGPQRA